MTPTPPIQIYTAVNIIYIKTSLADISISSIVILMSQKLKTIKGLQRHEGYKD